MSINLGHPEKVCLLLVVYMLHSEGNTGLGDKTQSYYNFHQIGAGGVRFLLPREGINYDSHVTIQIGQRRMGRVGRRWACLGPKGV